MSTPASIARHPVHPMLVGFPITFFVLAPVLDIIHVATGNPLWATIAFWDIVLGVVTGLAAAVPGFVDFLSLTGPVRRSATYHLALNLSVVAIFVVNLFLRGDAARYESNKVSTGQLVLSALAIGLLLVSGWIGGMLAYRFGVRVAAERDQAEGYSDAYPS